MNFRQGRRRREEATIELTPLIDVVFLLLIFFLLTSAMSKPTEATSPESSIPIELPEAQSGSRSITGSPVILTLTQDGRVELEGGDAPLEGDSVEAKLIELHKRDPQAQILLRGDQGATHGRVIELLDSVKQIGFKRVDLVISRPKEEP